MNPVPVTIVTGFLGAGKTTLLDQWLRAYAPGRVAVIVNELGAVGIDGDLLRSRVATLLEITGGCVCCATNGQLVDALSQLSRDAPQRIIVETSGAASPAGVVRAIHGNQNVRLDGIVTVVKAGASAAGHQNAEDLAAEQLGYADVVVISHADRVGEDVGEAVRASAASANPTAVIVCAARGVVRGHDDLESLLRARSTEILQTTPAFVRVVPEPSRHAAIESLVLSIDGDVDDERFGEWMEDGLGRFAGQLLRVKGIVAIAGIAERAILQGVADQIEVEMGGPWGDEPRRSRLVVIGFGLDRDELARGFAGCAAAVRADG